MIHPPALGRALLNAFVLSMIARELLLLAIRGVLRLFVPQLW